MSTKLQGFKPIWFSLPNNWSEGFEKNLGYRQVTCFDCLRLIFRKNGIQISEYRRRATIESVSEFSTFLLLWLDWYFLFGRKMFRWFWQLHRFFSTSLTLVVWQNDAQLLSTNSLEKSLKKCNSSSQNADWVGRPKKVFQEDDNNGNFLTFSEQKFLLHIQQKPIETLSKCIWCWWVALSCLKTCFWLNTIKRKHATFPTTLSYSLLLCRNVPY